MEALDGRPETGRLFAWLDRPDAVWLRFNGLLRVTLSP
jgi:hypothetical protein